MTRVLEQELMISEEQVSQYAKACAYFSGGLALFAVERLGIDTTIRSVADLGCGPCVYHVKLYTAFPNAAITAYDGSPQMLAEADKYIDPKKTTLKLLNFSDVNQSEARFDFVLASLVLHQLGDPLQLWAAIKHFGCTGAKFVVFDLVRVDDNESACHLVDALTPSNVFGDVFREDFKNSLRAAFTINEIKKQIDESGLTANVHRMEIAPGFVAVCVEGILS